MKRREFLYSCCCVMCASTSIVNAAGRATPAIALTKGKAILPASYAGITIPHSAIADGATALVAASSSVPLFNHVVRTYLFGASIGKKLGKVFDEEMLYLGCIMHDLGLTDNYIKEARFELDGADAAHHYLIENGFSETKAEVIWDAIALHASMEIPVRKRPEIALVHLGAFMDGGMNADMFPLSFFEEIFERYPQEGNKAHFIELVANVLTKKPHTAYLTFENDIGIRRVKDYHPLNYCDKKPAYPFNR